MNLEAGMLARAKAGHDKECIYVIISVNDEYVYLADGKLRPVCHPKKKNRKHVQPVACAHCDSVTDDVVIRKTVKEFLKKTIDFDKGNKQEVKKCKGAQEDLVCQKLT